MAPALNLPAPKHSDGNGVGEGGSSSSSSGAGKRALAARVEDVDEVTEQSSAAATNSASRYDTGGIIYPPPELRAIVDKTANYVARNGLQFESKIKGDGSSSRLAFLNDDDPYHTYYRARIEAIKDGTGPLANSQVNSAASLTSGDLLGANGEVVRADGEGPADALRQEREDAAPKRPAPFRFSVDLPTVTALDLDIVKLTALFVARRGRNFASALSAREGRSYQFEFLRPTHSLFGYFNNLVEQYRMIMDPSKETLEAIQMGAFATTQEQPEDAQPVTGIGRGGARLDALRDIEERAAYQKWERERRKMAEDEEAKERAAFDEVDWNDFVVAGTVELTEADAHIDLPPPMSLREVKNMSMAQKRMAAMIMEVEGASEREAVDTVGLVDRTGNAKALQQKASTGGEEEEAEMDVDDSDDEKKAYPTAPTPSMKPPTTNGPIKIRKDYQPKSLAERNAAAASQTTVCPVCKQEVPLRDMDDHVRYELLNPQFREQRRDLERKLAQHSALVEGANPSEALKQFAGKRTDIFGGAAEEEAQKRRAQDEARKRKERETLVWDGHAASRVDTTREFHQPQAMQQDMEHIQKRFKTDEPKTMYGPQGIPGQPAGLEGHREGFEGQTHTLAPAPEMPQGAATFAAAPVTAPSGPPPSAPTGPGSYNSQMQYNAPFGPQGGYGGYYSQMGPMPPNMQNHASMQSPGIQPQSLQMDGPGAPTPVVHKNPDGSLHSEAVWLQSHTAPISIRVQLPHTQNISSKCDGSMLTFKDLPQATTIGAIRDRIQAEVFNGQIGASRLKLRIDGTKATTLRQTLAHWNMENGDILTLNVS